METKEIELIQVVRRIAGVSSYIGLNTRVYQDLQIAGDDMDELVEDIFKKFGTSFVGMDTSIYCPNETEALIEFLLSKVGLAKKYPCITIAHLTKVVEAGYWTDPESEL